MGNKYTLHEEEKWKENELINKLTKKKEIIKLYSGKRKLYEQTERRPTTCKKQLLRYIQNANNLCVSTVKTVYLFCFSNFR